MPVEFSSSVSAFRDMDIAILPFPTLGDTTAYLHLAQSLADAGAHVSTYSEILVPVANLLPWLTIAVPSKSDIGGVFANHEPVIADILSPQIARRVTHSVARNLFCVNAKEMPKDFIPPRFEKCCRGLNSTAAIQSRILRWNRTRIVDGLLGRPIHG